MFPDVHPSKMIDAIEFSIDLGTPDAATDAAAAVLVHEHLGGRIARIVGGPYGSYDGIAHFYVVESEYESVIDFLGDRFRDFAAIEPAEYVTVDDAMAVPGAREAYATILARITARLA